MADEVSVLVSDLEEIKATLNATHKQNESWDIFDNYRKLNNRFQWSAMTRTISTTMTKVDAYIEEAQEDDSDSSTD